MDAADSARPPNEEQVLMGRFHLVILVMQRVKQLTNGARPRIERNGHKHVRVALAEVQAGAVSWSLGPTAETAGTAP